MSSIPSFLIASSRRAALRSGVYKAFRSSPSRHLQRVVPWAAVTHASSVLCDVMLTTTRSLSDSAGDHGVTLHYDIPHRVRQKVVSAQDAVALIRDGDTISSSGFVCQGVPEAVLKALGERYEETGHPNSLTLLFGGGPGDWATRGLNHLAKVDATEHAAPPMLRRTIGSHYGQVPQVAELVINEVVEAWTLPLGSISRMIRAQSTHSPGHITNVGIGTYVDPDHSGGAANESGAKSKLHPKLVSKIEIDGQVNLMYKALPINVAVIRGTTADAQGNITCEQESLLCDQKILAAAAKNSGGLVIAQVKRLAANGSLPSRSIAVPGPLVDAIVIVDKEDHDTLHPMSFVEAHNPALTGEIKTPQDELRKMKLDIRKLIARRAFFNLRPDKIINLGIGLPEGVANIAAEEGMLEYVTLSTEPGVFGGLPASGHSFGPAINASALIEMNQMFDFYDGGGLDMCFLGAAQVSKNGDVNVSRMTKDRLTGPGGFIDISQSTRRICFLTPFTAKGLELGIPGDGTLKIEKEGSVKKFVNDVYERTFSGDEAVRRGQEVYYVSERAVFRRTAWHDEIELIEIAPGLDLERDILSQMEFKPAISPELKTMDPRIFMEAPMNVMKELFGSLEDRLMYDVQAHVMYLTLFGISLNTEEDIKYFFTGLEELLAPKVAAKGPIDMVVNYDGFDLRKGLEDKYKESLANLEAKYYNSVKRYTGAAFHRARLGQQIHAREWDPAELFDLFDANKNGKLSLEELRTGMYNMFQIRLTPSQLCCFAAITEGKEIDQDTFAIGIQEVLKSV